MAGAWRGGRGRLRGGIVCLGGDAGGGSVRCHVLFETSLGRCVEVAKIDTSRRYDKHDMFSLFYFGLLVNHVISRLHRMFTLGRLIQLHTTQLF